jgi:hypothetical protein
LKRKLLESILELVFHLCIVQVSNLVVDGLLLQLLIYIEDNFYLKNINAEANVEINLSFNVLL